jgi:hypothetical protein
MNDKITIELVKEMFHHFCDIGYFSTIGVTKFLKKESCKNIADLFKQYYDALVDAARIAAKGRGGSIAPISALRDNLIEKLKEQDKK